MPINLQIKKISTKDELQSHMGEIISMLSRAFYNDPYYRYIMPNNKRRLSQIEWWMSILLKYSLKNGEIYVSSNNKGAAMWIGPNNPILDNVQLALLGLIFYPLKIGIGNFIRMLDVSTQWENFHKKESDKHYYLMIIGVDPDFQRKQIGSLLMKDVLAKADQENRFCYLETMTTENVSFYKKHGFETIEQRQIKNGSIYWIMKRNPQKIAK